MSYFPRPRPPGRTPVQIAQPLAKPKPATDTVAVPQAEPFGTCGALIALLFTAVFLQGQTPSSLARFAAIGTAIGLAISLTADLKLGFQNLIRADVMAIVAYYFLTFFEFLLPQPNFDLMISLESARTATYIVLVGFVGLLIGRHLVKARAQPFGAALTAEVPSAWIVTIFLLCLVLGYFYMFLSTNFDAVAVVKGMMAPRFTQPWQRGRLGDWKALLGELALFIYLIPPLAGIIFARHQRYNVVSLLLVLAGLFFTLFYGFVSGTRNVFDTYLVTFLIGYAFATPPGRNLQLMIMTGIIMVSMLAATVMMLRFRNVGFENYYTGKDRPVESAEKSLFVDYNLYAVGRLAEVFPSRVHYLGLEIPFQAIIRPIPRAIWPGKPEGLSTSIEDAMGVEGLTIAASFAGEAYMSGGNFAVLLAGLFFGAATAWWSYLASPKNSELGILIYASGFFAAVISMRSLLVFAMSLLPTAAAIVICVYTTRYLAKRARRLLTQILVPQRPPLGPRR